MAEPKRARLLVVDDDPGIRRTLERVLGPQHEVVVVGGAAAALERLAGGDVDVALVDVQLADRIDGFELCGRIHEISPLTDVILMTGSVSQQDEKLYRSLEQNAFYFLLKPFERRVIRALVDRCLRLRRERDAKEAYAADLARDLERARLFQLSLLPAGPVRLGDWEVHGRCELCEALGGDFYFGLAERGGGLVCGVCDVVGHGMRAAMFAGMLRSTLDAARRLDPDPRSVAERLAGGVDFFGDSGFATMVYALLGEGGRVTYFNAGHPGALWLRRDRSVVDLPVTGLILSSVFARARRGVEEIVVAPGERLLLYSDGVIEARNPAGAEWGTAGLRSALGRCAGIDSEGALEGIAAELRTHRAGRPLEDDTTLLLIERASGDRR